MRFGWVFGVQGGVEKGVERGAVGDGSKRGGGVVAGELDEGEVGFREDDRACGADLGLVAGAAGEEDVSAEGAGVSGGGGDAGEEGLCGRLVCLGVSEGSKSEAEGEVQESALGVHTRFYDGFAV